MYKCEICGKEYATLKERVTCETACISRLEKEEAEAKVAENTGLLRGIRIMYDSFKLLGESL